MRNSFMAVLFGLSVAASGCASKQASPDTEANATDATVLVVKNDSYLDHNMYLLQGSQRIRLGTARGLATTRFTIPQQYIFGVSSLQFLADPIGSNETPISERINVAAGDEIQLTIRGR